MKHKICVIGGGAAGLCAGRHMIHAPEKYDFIIFEQTADIGGTWVYTDKIGTDEYKVPIHSSMYKNLRTNVPKEIMGYPDFPFPNSGKSFIHHSEVLSYLKNYANTHGLIERIKFLSLVKSITPEELTPNKRIWKVVVVNLKTGIDETYTFDGVMVCNGHYAVPRIPEIEGIESFSGETIHSHAYRQSEIYRGKTIVVLGAAASGMDIAIELSLHAKRIYLSHNNERKASKLPENIIEKPGIKMAINNGFYFLDESFAEADVLMYCTGYKYSFPFLTDKCNVKIEGNRVTPMYKHLIHMEYPELCFIGIPFTVLPFPLFHYQVLYYLKCLDGETIKLPDIKTMEKETEEDYKKRVVELKMPPKYAHKLGSLQWDYFRDMSKLTDEENLPPVHQMIFDEVDGSRSNNVMFYKKQDYRLLNEEKFFKIAAEP